MKTRTLLIIVISVATSLILLTNYEFTNQSDSGHFNYQYTTQIIQDTYLGKTVSQWQNESFDSLMSYHEAHGDLFFAELGPSEITISFPTEQKTGDRVYSLKKLQTGNEEFLNEQEIEFFLDDNLVSLPSMIE